jgi:hypothetical protein
MNTHETCSEMCVVCLSEPIRPGFSVSVMGTVVALFTGCRRCGRASACAGCVPGLTETEHETRFSGVLCRRERLCGTLSMFRCPLCRACTVLSQADAAGALAARWRRRALEADDEEKLAGLRVAGLVIENTK